MKKIIGIFLVLYLLVGTTISGVYAVSGAINSDIRVNTPFRSICSKNEERMV